MHANCIPNTHVSLSINLFGSGDPEDKEFWMKLLPAAKDLANRFVTVED
jgi:hypothetical protein